MNRLAISQKQVFEVLGALTDVRDQEGCFDVDIELDDCLTVNAFNDKLDFDGVILTKLDGDTRGGAALTIKSVVNKPIKFIGVGEKMEALDVFHPDRMAERILGMGDIRSFVEKAQFQFDEEETSFGHCWEPKQSRLFTRILIQLISVLRLRILSLMPM